MCDSAPSGEIQYLVCKAVEGHSLWFQSSPEGHNVCSKNSRDTVSGSQCNGGTHYLVLKAFESHNVWFSKYFRDKMSDSESILGGFQSV